MPSISIQRSHQLGLKRAREVAWKWAEDAEAKFDMECTVEEGEDEDLVHFMRIGVKGTLRVSGERFDLVAQLGLLLGAFQKTIESQIESNLDTLLAAETKAGRKAPAAAPSAAPKKAAARKSAARGK
jgi:putative polyhydroxyalkanoate system protein